MKNIAETRPAWERMALIGLASVAPLIASCNLRQPQPYKLILRPAVVYQESLSIKYIDEYLTKLTRTEIVHRGVMPFDKQTKAVLLDEPVRLVGRPLFPRDFPDNNVGWFTNHIKVDPSKLFDKFVVIYQDQISRNRLFAAAYFDPITRTPVFINVGGPKQGWKFVFVNKNGIEIDGETLFGHYLPPASISYSRGLGRVWGFERNLRSRRAA